jgi:pimeloyl-ACP methyl ester carboxylesterase
MPQNIHETATAQFAEAGGIRFAYRRFGRRGGTPSPLLNYFAANLDRWDPRVTNGFAADREVILVDYPGIGGSSGETPSTVAALTDPCVEFYRALGLTRLDVLFSLGGMIAQQLTADHPEMVRCLILYAYQCVPSLSISPMLSSSRTRMRATLHFRSMPRTSWKMRGCFSGVSRAVALVAVQATRVTSSSPLLSSRKSVAPMSTLMRRASSTHSTPRCCRSPGVADP